MEQAKQKLIEQLATKEDEVLALQTLQTRNQQLEKRVAELEKAPKSEASSLDTFPQIVQS
jgi:cell division septum initiation protein DivIVA